MAQHDYSIANQTAANARTDINNALSAIVSNNSGASAPSTTYANMWWYDSSTNKLKIRNEADSAWIEVGELNQTANTFNGGTPAGAVMTFAMSTAPSGWLKCNGAAVSRTTYAKLFAAIGTAYGAGDGSTTFNLPELRGEFVRGWDDGRGVDNGRTLGSTQSEEIGEHQHLSPYVNESITQTRGSDWFAGYVTDQEDAEGNFVDVAGGGHGELSVTDTKFYTPPLGTDENRPRNVALNYCIKY